MSGVTNDLDEMTRVATRLADAGDWEGVQRHRDGCRAALERGLQLWPVASYCEYLLALDAPAEFAAQILVAGTGRFAMGPLTEVAAANHSWSDLAPHAPSGPVAAMAAHERVVRGEDLGGVDVADAYVLEVPLRLQQWEPAYPLAQYTREKADFPSPGVPPLSAVETHSADVVDEFDGTSALRDLASVWTTESNGRIDVVCVDGDVGGALHALGVHDARAASIEGGDASALMAWAAASGGAHGRRRGMAIGRFAAWWAAAAVAGELDGWPVSADAMAEVVTQRLNWYVWGAGEPATGWELRIAIEDPSRRVAYAIAAIDSV